MKDNSIFPVTRAVMFIVVLFLLAAFAILFFVPDRTGELFAWAIEPHMSAMFIGAAYLGGAWILLQTAVGKHWHRVQAVFPAVTIFTIAMLLSTVLHWDRFSHGTLGFNAWLILYIISPFLIPALWLYNKRTDSKEPEKSDLTVSITARLNTRIIAALVLLLVTAGFLYPRLPISIWPWALTPLTARVLCGWLSVIGISGLMISFDPRWTAWRTILEGIFIADVFILIATIINPSDFKISFFNWLTFFMTGMFLTIFVFYIYMEIQRRRLIE